MWVDDAKSISVWVNDFPEGSREEVWGIAWVTFLE